jgi:hypothetical protein
MNLPEDASPTLPTIFIVDSRSSHPLRIKLMRTVRIPEDGKVLAVTTAASS